jgi:acid phosphatase
MAITCVAPLAFAPPLNLTLLAVFLFTRHGARTPVDNWARRNETGHWTCDSPSALSPRMHSTELPINRRLHLLYDEPLLPLNTSCQNGDLILEGMQQHEELGQAFRRKYVDELHFLPDRFDTDLIALRSSSSERCIRSLISFVNGLYPPQFPDELLNVRTAVNGKEVLSPDPYWCPELEADYAKFIKTDEFKARAAHAKIVQQPLYKYLGLEWDGENWQWLGDWLYSFACSGQAIPPVVTPEMLDLAMNDTAYYTAGFFSQYSDDAVGGIWRILIKSIDELLSGNARTRFQLISAHDSTLAAILVALGYVDLQGTAPYRSHIAVELYGGDRPHLRFVYNGKVLKVGGEELIPLPKFKLMFVDSLSKCLDV